MSISIRLKHSASKDKAPVAADLAAGELALNTNVDSPAAYLKDSAGNIVKLAGAGSITDVDAVKKTDAASQNMIGDLTLGTDKITLDAANGTANFYGNVKILGAGGTLADPRIFLNNNGTITAGAGCNFNLSNQANTGALIGAMGLQGGMYYLGGNLGVTTPNPAKKIQFTSAIGGTVTATITVASGNATFNGTVTATVVPPSDARFKENITPANPQLADVVALGGLLKNYDWNADAPVNEELRKQRQLGLIAQEAEKVCPGLVKIIARTKQGKELTPAVVDSDGVVTTDATYEELDDSYRGLSTDVIIMKLLGAVAELKAEVEALKTA